MPKKPLVKHFDLTARNTTSITIFGQPRTGKTTTLLTLMAEVRINSLIRGKPSGICFSNEGWGSIDTSAEKYKGFDFHTANSMTDVLSVLVDTMKRDTLPSVVCIDGLDYLSKEGSTVEILGEYNETLAANKIVEICTRSSTGDNIMSGFENKTILPRHGSVSMETWVRRLGGRSLYNITAKLVTRPTAEDNSTTVSYKTIDVTTMPDQ